jgi:nitroreductase
MEVSMQTKRPEEIGLFEALYSTRALRRFKPDPVPDELLFQVIDAAIRAPAGSNQQVWHFLIVRDEGKRRQIGQWYWETWASYGRQYVEDPSRIDALPRQMRLVVRSTDDLARNFASVPVHLFVCGPQGAAGTIYPAVQNLLLACRGLGLGSVLTGFHRAHHDKLVELLKIPEGQVAHAVLPIGWPRDRIGPVERRPVWKVTSVDEWGREWEFAKRQPEEGWRERWLR